MERTVNILFNKVHVENIRLVVLFKTNGMFSSSIFMHITFKQK